MFLSDFEIRTSDFRLRRARGQLLMYSSFFLAWYQLSHNKVKLAVAAAGVVVAVMLMLVQLGIRQGAMDNSVAVARRVTADLVVVSPRTKTIFASAQFPENIFDPRCFWYHFWYQKNFLR